MQSLLQSIRDSGENVIKEIGRKSKLLSLEDPRDRVSYLYNIVCEEVSGFNEGLANLGLQVTDLGDYEPALAISYASELPQGLKILSHTISKSCYRVTFPIETYLGNDLVELRTIELPSYIWGHNASDVQSVEFIDLAEVMLKKQLYKEYYPGALIIGGLINLVNIAHATNRFFLISEAKDQLTLLNMVRDASQVVRLGIALLDGQENIDKT